MGSEEPTLAIPVEAVLQGGEALPSPGSDLDAVSGPRLNQLLLFGMVGLIVLLVALSGIAQVIAISWEYESQARDQTVRVQTQTRESGAATARLIAVSASRALPHNDFAFLSSLAASLTRDDPRVLRVQIFDRDGRVAADSKEGAPATAETERGREARVTTATYEGVPAFEYQEPVDYSGHGKGLVVLTYSLQTLQQELLRLDEGRRAAVSRTTVRTIGVGVIFLVLGSVVAVYQSRRVTRPIQTLTETAQELARGNLSVRVPEQRGAGREVATLGWVFNDMGEKLNRLISDAGSRAVDEHQLQVGRTLQQSVMPDARPLELGPLRVSGRVVGADHFGGEWWIRLPLDERRVVVALGDSGGQGVATGLLATSALTALTAVTRTQAPERAKPDFLLQALHQTVLALGRGTYQMTAAIAVLDVGTGELELALAGHPPPCVVNRGTGELTPVPFQSQKVGSLQFSCRSLALKLRPGEVMVFASDGILTTRGADSSEYGLERMKALVQQNVRLPSEQLCEAVLQDVAQFRGDAPQHDDMTVVVAERLERTPRS